MYQTSCPLKKGCRKNSQYEVLPFITAEPFKSDYALVLDKPYGINSMLSSKLEEVVHSFKEKLRLNDLYITSLSKCKKEPTKACLPMLVDELKKVMPKRIMILGTAAADIMGIHGSAFDNRIKFNTFRVEDMFSRLDIPALVTLPIDSVYDLKGGVIYNTLNLLKNAKDYSPEYEVITDPEKLYNILETVKRWSLDFEAPPPEYKPYSMAISTEDKNFYVEFNNIPLSKFSKIFKLTNNKIIHSQYELGILKSAGLEYDMNFSDTWLYSYVIDPNRDSYSLKHLVADYFLQPDYSVDFNTYTSLPVGERGRYNVLDSYFTLKLFNLFQNEIGDERTRNLFKYIVNPFMHVLHDMNYYGINIDEGALQSLINTIKDKKDVLKQEVFRFKSIPKDLNLDSPQQLSDLIYNKWKIKVHQFTKHKEPSCSHEALGQLAKIYKSKEKIFTDLSEYSAMSGSYDLLKKFNSIKQGNKIHSKYWPHNTSTGRLSSEKPNLQNIPPEYRYFIVPEKGVFFDMDVSQSDIRMLAQESGDAELIRQLASDIHTGIAAIRFEKPENEITSDERRDSKPITFGMMYGMSEYGLSKSLSVGVEEATRIRSRLMSRLGNVAVFWSNTKKFLFKNLYVQSMFGRRRYFTSQQLAIDQDAVIRQAINAPIQSDTNDIIFLISSILKSLLCRYKRTNTVNMQIHDEIIMTVDEPIDFVFEEVSSIFVDTLAKFNIKLKLPILLEYGYGSRLGQITKNKIWTILPDGTNIIKEKIKK